MNKEHEMCTCCTCGYKWRRGQDGSHSCAVTLKAKLDALPKEKFVVVAGKFETDPEDHAGDGRNYKFSGEPKTSLTEAIGELMTVAGYPFSEIEFRDANGKHWIVQAYPDTRPRLTTCKHCKTSITQEGTHWMSVTHSKETLGQYCWVDPQGGSQLHEPE